MSAPSRSGSPDRPARALAFAAALSGVLAAGPALACEPRMARPPAAVVLRYDPFDTRQAPGEIAFTVANRGDAECRFAVALVDEEKAVRRTLLLSDAPVEVEFRPAAGGGALAPAAEPGVWTGSVAAGAETEFKMVAVVTRDGIPLAGRHERRLFMELRDAAAPAPTGTGAPFTVALEAPPRSQLNIAGATGRFGEGPGMSSVDLGVLSEGVNRRVFLQVRSNVASSRLGIRSQNGGLLKPEGVGVPAEAAGVPYRLILLDEPIDLADRYERSVEAPRTLAGASLPMDIVVGETAGRMAGRYSDTLTIEFSPL